MIIKIFRWKYISMIAVVLFLATSCADAYVNKTPIFSSHHIIFPRVFSGITWGYNEAFLQSRMPNSKVQNIEYDGENGPKIDSIFSNVSLYIMGNVAIDVDHNKRGEIDSIDIATIDPREQCSPGHPIRANNCRNIRDERLNDILHATANYITQHFGKPIKSIYFEGNSKNISYKWVTDSVDIILGMHADDDGSWAVDVSLLPIKKVKN